MKRAVLLLWFLALGAAQGAHAPTDTGIPLVVPGSELGWDDSAERLVLRVERTGEVWLQMFSPGFDPGDYRSPYELGDERYDRGRGTLVAVYGLWQGRHLLARKTFGVEPHRWATLFRGRLQPGNYEVRARFYGNGKNAVVFRLRAAPGVAKLLLPLEGMRTFNVTRGGWQEPFSLYVPRPSPGLRVGIYDGDGPGELEVEVRTPDGRLRPTAPGNLEWRLVPAERAGLYRFRFRLPPGATQYTNTVGVKIFPGSIRVEVVDTDGHPVPDAGYRVESGPVRQVMLLKPPGWRLARTEVHGGRIKAPGRVEFGMGSGSVRFVLSREAAPARLTLASRAACGEWDAPFPLTLNVGRREVRIPSTGALVLSLPAGSYPLSPQPVPGARIEGDRRVSLKPGGTATARFRVRPRIDLQLRVADHQVRVGRRVRITVEARTEFPRSLPVTLRLALPAGLRPLGPTELRARLARDRPLRLGVWVEAERPGRYRLAAQLLPCGVRAETPVNVPPPARFALEKRALTPEVVLGQEATFVVEVRNVGGAPGTVRLIDPTPPGFAAPGLDEILRLGPGESVRRTIQGQARAGPIIENRARLVVGERTIARASAKVRVLRPDVEIARRMERSRVVPGERDRACLTVKNTGEAPLDYRLADRVPDWVAPEETPRFSGRLAPGAERTHCYAFRIRFGKPVEGAFEAVLTSSAGHRSASERLARILLPLEAKAVPSRVYLGQKVVFHVRIKNPLGRPLRLRLVDVPATGLGLQRTERTLLLPAGGTVALDLEAHPTKQGTLANRVLLFGEGALVAWPATATVEVRPPPPVERVSTVTLSFQVQGRGNAILLRHAPPPGARYRRGSSRLDGKPLPDPRVDDRGRLYWLIPFQARGTLTYRLDHTGPLPELKPPEIALVAGGQTEPLSGRVDIEAYRAARPFPPPARQGLIRAPEPGRVFVEQEGVRVVVEAPPGSPVALFANGRPVAKDRLAETRYDPARKRERWVYEGVPLRVGRNTLEARAGDRRDVVVVFRSGAPTRVELAPVHAVADGRTPLRFKLRFLDTNGLPAGSGYATVATSPEPLAPDAAPAQSGYQVRLRRGEAELVLRPLTTPGEVRVLVKKGGLTARLRRRVPAPDATFYLAQGSATVRYASGRLEAGGQLRAYVEAPLAGGRLQAAVGQALNRGTAVPDLAPPALPPQRFPLTGAGEDDRRPLASGEGVAFRYDRGAFSVGYGSRLPSTLLGLPPTSALAVEYRGPVKLTAFATLLASRTRTLRIQPDGTRVYRLGQAVAPGSETVWIETAAGRRRLEPGRDYVLDHANGLLYLSRPLWPTGTDLTPQTLVVSFAPADAPRDLATVGAEASIERSGFGLQIAAASQGGELRFGLSADYRLGGLQLRSTYRYTGDHHELALSGEGTAGPVSVSGHLRYAGALAGSGQAALTLGGGNRLVLDLESGGGQEATSLLLEHLFGEGFLAGMGVGYDWSRSSFALLGRAGYRLPGTSVRLTHVQPVEGRPESRLEVTHAIDENLDLAGSLRYRWGTGLDGTLALHQKLGQANLALSYRLPGASGDGNRARFGIRAPLPLGPHWSLDLSAGYERDFATHTALIGAGLGARYSGEAVSATLGLEGATGSSGTRVTLRSGVAGQLDRRQVIAFDASYQLLPQLEGALSLAYAYRGRTLQVLSYHRLDSESRVAKIQGELAATWQPSPSFQIRPQFAYRSDFADHNKDLYQVGLNFNYFLTPRLGLGAGGYYLYRAVASSGLPGFSVEGNARILGPIWLSLGYTFGQAEGVTEAARPGIYARLDVFGWPHAKAATPSKGKAPR